MEQCQTIVRLTYTENVSEYWRFVLITSFLMPCGILVYFSSYYIICSYLWSWTLSFERKKEKKFFTPLTERREIKNIFLWLDILLHISMNAKVWEKKKGDVTMSLQSLRTLFLCKKSFLVRIRIKLQEKECLALKPHLLFDNRFADSKN